MGITTVATIVILFQHMSDEYYEHAGKKQLTWQINEIASTVKVPRLHLNPIIWNLSEIHDEIITENQKPQELHGDPVAMGD